MFYRCFVTFQMLQLTSYIVVRSDHSKFHRIAIQHTGVRLRFALAQLFLKVPSHLQRSFGMLKSSIMTPERRKNSTHVKMGMNRRAAVSVFSINGKCFLRMLQRKSVFSTDTEIISNVI
jgi:hypothetical protein